VEEGIEDLENLESDFCSSWLKPTLEEGQIIEAVVLAVASREASFKIKDYK